MVAPLTLHVALLFEFPALNGGEHSMLSVLQQLAVDSTIRFTAIAPTYGPLADQLKQLHIPLVPFSVRSSTGVKRDIKDLTVELQTIVATLRPNILHANSLSMSRLVAQCQEKMAPAYCTGHIRDIMKISARMIGDLNRLSSIAVVSKTAKDFHEAQGLRSGLSKVIYNGVDTDRFCKRSRADARNALLPQLPKTARVLLNVGQICLRKGQLDLAQAVVQLLRDRNDVYLVLVGERHSGKVESIAYERAIADEFTAFGRKNHLLRIGYSDNVEQWMNSADLLVHTARQEPLGRVLLEAAASELPTIATDVGGTPEILQHEQSGILVPPGDVKALVGCIHAALAKPSRGQAYATSAVEHIRQIFTVRQACQALKGFWQSANSPALS